MPALYGLFALGKSNRIARDSGSADRARAAKRHVDRHTDKAATFAAEG